MVIAFGNLSFSIIMWFPEDEISNLICCALRAVICATNTSVKRWFRDLVLRSYLLNYVNKTACNSYLNFLGIGFNGETIPTLSILFNPTMTSFNLTSSFTPSTTPSASSFPTSTILSPQSDHSQPQAPVIIIISIIAIISVTIIILLAVYWYKLCKKKNKQMNPIVVRDRLSSNTGLYFLSNVGDQEIL